MYPKDQNCDISELRKFISYDPEAGELRWIAPKQKIVVGNLVGWNDSRGYINIGFCGFRLLGHRVAWALFYGEWPKSQLDHKNCNPYDNRIGNLREATDQQNKANTPGHSRIKYSKYKGVTWDKRRQKWLANIYRGRGKFLGYFTTEEAAFAAYCAASLAADGNFAHASVFSSEATSPRT